MVELAHEYHERKLEALGRQHPDVATVRRLLAELYGAWEKPEKAELWR